MFSKLKYAVLASAISFAGVAHSQPKAYTFDTSHSQIVFSFQHLGFSTTTGLFSGIKGTINFDDVNPAASSVTAEFPLASLMTGDKDREQHFLSSDFFGGEGKATSATFRSTSIEITGERTGRITGDLTLNGVTKVVLLEAILNQKGQHPMENTPWIGFNATTTVKRSDFNLGMYVPVVSDDVAVEISVEARGPN